jgi:hypothetical protein
MAYLTNDVDGGWVGRPPLWIHPPADASGKDGLAAVYPLDELVPLLRMLLLEREERIHCIGERIHHLALDLGQTILAVESKYPTPPIFSGHPQPLILAHTSTTAMTARATSEIETLMYLPP